MITKRDMALRLTMEDGRMPDAVARILGISVSQVVKLVLQESKWKPKPRKPKPNRKKTWEETTEKIFADHRDLFEKLEYIARKIRNNSGYICCKQRD